MLTTKSKMSKNADPGQVIKSIMADTKDFARFDIPAPRTIHKVVNQDNFGTVMLNWLKAAKSFDAVVFTWVDDLALFKTSVKRVRAYDRSPDGRPWWTKEMNGKTSLAEHIAEAWKATPGAIAFEAKPDGLYVHTTKDTFGPVRDATTEDEVESPKVWNETWKPHLEFSLST